MKKTREASASQITRAEKATLVACLALMGVTHVEITMFTPSNAKLIANGFTPSPQTIEAETQEWYDVIHSQPNIYGSSVNGGFLRVFDRAVFPEAGDNQGQLFNFPIETATPLGDHTTAATDGDSTWCGRYYNYLYNHVTAAHCESGDIQCPFAEISARAFSGAYFTNQAGAHTFVRECHLIATAWAASVGKTITFLNNPNFSEVSSGWWGGSPSVYTDSGFVCYDYYGAARSSAQTAPSDYQWELEQVYAGISPTAGYGIGAGGFPQVWGEWGDLSGSIKIPGKKTGDNFVVGTTIFEDWVNYWVNFIKMLTTLSDAGKLAGVNFWGGWEAQNTSLLYKTGSGANSQYFPNWRGQLVAQAFRGLTSGRRPVNILGTFTEASPSFGGRDMHY